MNDNLDMRSSVLQNDRMEETKQEDEVTFQIKNYILIYSNLLKIYRKEE